MAKGTDGRGGFKDVPPTKEQIETIVDYTNGDNFDINKYLLQRHFQ